MIPLLIPSKNRAMQLDLLLRSIAKNCNNLFHPYILLKTSSKEYEDGYNKLWDKQILSLTIKIEKNIEKDILNFLNKFPIFCIATDDCVIFRGINIIPDDVINTLDEEVFTVSLRLGKNTIIQNYIDGSKQPELINFEQNGPFIKWNWKIYPPLTNYWYCMGMDFHCFKSEDWIKLIDFQIPNLRYIESAFVNKHSKIEKEFICSLEHSCSVNIPATNCQEPFIANGLNTFTLEELNQRYINGQIIDLDLIEKTEVVGAHQKIPYLFKEYNESHPNK